MKNTYKIAASRAGVALLITVVVVTAAVSFRAFSQIEEAGAARKHTLVVINSADDLLSELKDAETGQLGYLLTGDEAFLEPYLAVRDSLGDHLEKLGQRTRISAARKYLDALAPLINAKLADLSQVIELRRTHGMTAALANVRGSSGKPLMDSIRAEIKSFSQIERGVLAQNDAEFQANMRILFIVIVIASLLVLLLALSFAFFIYREIKNRLKNFVLLETQHLLEIQEETNKQLQQANVTLLISEGRLAVTLNSIGDAVIATDAEARVTLLNPIAEKLTGWTQAQAAGRPVDEIFHIINEETRQPAVVPIKETLARGTIQGLANHTVLIARSGSECAIADSCAPIRSRDGQVVGAVLVFHDITERRKIESGLEKTRKELEITKKISDEASELAESVINTVREPLISLDQDLRVLTVNRSFYDFFKVKPEETVGQLIYDLGNKQWDIPKLRELLETILPQKASFDNYEVEHDFATIGRRIMLLNARQIQRASGKERIILLAIEDITGRKHIESELQETRNELERIVQAQKLVITDTKESLDLETEGRLFDESEISHRQEALEAVYAMETTFDFSIESLYDQIVSSISATLRIPSVAIYEYRDGKIIRGSRCLDKNVSREIPHPSPCTACQSVLGNKNPQQFTGDLGKQFAGKLCFDTVRFHSCAGVQVNGSQGEVFGMINVLDDKKRAFTDPEIQFIETFARYIAHELSRRDLESRLIRADEMRLLGQLTSGVAHEVRNPLNGIMAIMGALSKELSATASLEPYLMHMRSQVSRLKLLMDGLLELGRPIREENMQEISLVKLVENSIATWLQTIQKSPREILFHQSKNTDDYIIKAEIARVTQMIINLLENAHNHSPADTPIALSIHRSGNAQATLIIKDCGRGIPAEILPRIFEPFFTTRKGGTGLGLSIVRRIVENHQGSVSAYNNTSGPGATFEIVLPLHIRQ
jgi:PAS domain S-box-containing protein